MSYTSSSAQPRMVHLIVRDEAPLWEQGLFVVWFFTLFLRVPQFTSLMFLCLLAILGLFALHATRTMPSMIKAWPLLIYPVFGLISSGWSAFPSQGISQGILLLITPFVLVTIAVRLPPKLFFRCLTIGGALATAYLAQPGIQFHGPNAIMHKQVLAYHLLLICVPSLVSAVNDEEITLVRVMGLLTAIIAFSLQLVAESVTSIGLTAVAFIFILGAKLVWVPMAKIAHLRTLLFVLFCVLICTAALIVLAMPQNSLVEDAFDMVGKDTTLTGRTIIWEYAELASESHPIFGQGLGAFWHADVGIASSVAEASHMKPGTNISFHSVYWETRVHLGWVGLVIVCSVLLYSIFLNFRHWLRESSLLNSGLLMMTVTTASTFGTESYLTGAFDMIVTSFYMGALYAMRPGQRRIAVPAVPKLHTEQPI
ncbi:MAG: O-antigen ligase family protein [Pseudomonadota bacterium]